MLTHTNTHNYNKITNVAKKYYIHALWFNNLKFIGHTNY